MKASAVCIVFLALLISACGNETSSPGGRTGSKTSAEGLPAPVADKHAAILAAAGKGDYEALRPLIDQETFLSDFGFGRDAPDPVDRWQELGPKPLQIMGAVLRMPHAVRETNEGTLYQWPSLGPDSKERDLSAEERELFSQVLTEDELENLILPELGYTGPRLGLLADGGWWFFILGGA
jgi:hypothetical protein